MFLPVSEVEPRSLVKMVPVHHSSTKQLNLELGEREEMRTYNYDRGRGRLSLSQNKILLCFPSETTILCNLCWSTTPSDTAQEDTCPRVDYCPNISVLSCAEIKREHQPPERSLSCSPLVVLGHNRRRDEEEKTKTNISRSRNANIRLLSLKKLQVVD